MFVIYVFVNDHINVIAVFTPLCLKQHELVV